MQPRSLFRLPALFTASILVFSTAHTLRAQSSPQTSVVSFGSVSLGSTSTQTVTLSNLLSTPASFVLTYGIEFTTTSAPTCSGSPLSCSIQIQFAPAAAGWRQDGLLAEDISGNILGTALLNGVGQGEQPIFLPGVISTIGGSGTNFPTGIATDPQGKYIYIADDNNHVVKRMNVATGVTTVYVGTGGSVGYSGDGGQATSAQIGIPSSVALDAAGDLFIADVSHNVVREVVPTGIISTFVGNSAGLSQPYGLAVDAQGNLYIADQNNNEVRKVTPSGNVTTFAGTGSLGRTGDGGLATSAQLFFPSSVAVDSAGNVYIAEENDVRKVTTDGNIHLFAGTEGSGGYSGDGGPATSATLSGPQQMTVDAAGNLYIADRLNNVIREVDTSGVIHTIVGSYNMSGSYSGDGGPPTSARLSAPNGIAVAPNGTIFFTDSGNNVIRAVSYAAPTFSFAATTLGSESSSQSTTIENIGNAAMAFTGLAVSSNFVQTASGGTDCSASTNLAVDGTCDIAVAFEPLVGGSLSGNVTVTNSPYSIPLNGTANGPGANLNLTSLSFGNQTIATTSTASTVTLTNSGNQTLTISGIGITGTNAGDFSQTNNCGSTLAASASCTISVTFTPSNTGLRSASLSISDNASGSPQAVSLTGTGTLTTPPPVNVPLGLNLSATSLTFGNQNVVTRSAAQTITVSNTAAQALSTGNIALSGANAADFSVWNNCGLTLAQSATCTINVTFWPLMPGTRTATLTVGASGSLQTISLSGTAQLSGAFEIVSMPTGKLLEVPNGVASDGTLIDQNSLNGYQQQEWLFIPTGDGYYEIQNVLTGKVLDVVGGYTTGGTLIQQWDYLGGSNQQWQLMPVDDVHYAIVNRNSGMALDVINGSSANGVHLQQWTYLGDPQQLWNLVPAVSYNITNNLSSYVLDVSSGLTANGTPIQQSTLSGYRQQQWQLIPVGDGYYAIMNRNSGKVLDVVGGSMNSGALIQEWDYLGGENQQWQVVPLSATSYQLVNRLSGCVLDDTNYSTVAGTYIQQWQSEGTSNQQWQITAVTYYNIANKNSGLVLDVVNGSAAAGANIQQWPADGLQQQQWQLIPTSNGNYAIMNNLTSEVLDANTSTTDGTLIQQSSSDGYAQQQWQLVSEGGSYYAIMNRNSGKALDMTGGYLSAGDLLQQWDYLGGANQQWQLVPVSVTTTNPTLK